ncbi:D-hexose-6-phosphate mutarotase [Shewanella acanthi]|uniref:D-hexose-6-phosphate mutarotase n=1 Tax=Shewanella acanthi TaxID=2864212 RepID=UPI001C6620C6|nr:D-hexose-6-phosphate mutarotase [Shewanella acanthi]QYJ77624.1 D-hexose-6-phosphate mutarotase [Shewanella acanthi]
MGSVTTKTHANGLEYIEVNTHLCEARIFLQGAQIEHFQPVGKPPLLWVSSADDYQPGNGIRGGVPVCWPWFGMSSEPDFPQHGFARTRIWTLDSVEMRGQLVDLRFSLTLTEEDCVYWPHNTQVKVLFTLGDSLSISLVNTNLDKVPVTITQALHTYFPIQDIHQLRATGFEGAKYIEFAEGPYPQTTDEVTFTRETDRVYTDLTLVQQLHTPQGIIEVSRENSHSAVLWNPWIDKSQRLARFNDDDYLTMVCLEAANVLEDKLILAPGESHTLVTHIRWLD